MKIRKAKPSDLRKIADIFKIEFRKKPYNEKWTKQGALKEIKIYLKTSLIFVITEKNEIEGFLVGMIDSWWDGKRSFIKEVIVSGKSQGKGYGKALTSHFENYSKKRKIKTISLMANTKSKAFKIYKKLKYREHGFVSMEKKL